MQKKPPQNLGDAALNALKLVSLASLAEQFDADRTTVRRWLRLAGVQPVVLGHGRNGSVRYRWADVEQWLRSRESAR